MAYCPMCDKKFKDRNALQGHFRFKHGIEYESGMPAKRSVLTEVIKDSIGESRSSKSKSIEKLDTIELTLMYIVDKLEKVHNELRDMKKG